jgi:hypothetical protein
MEGIKRKEKKGLSIKATNNAPTIGKKNFNV